MNTTNNFHLMDSDTALNISDRVYFEDMTDDMDTIFPRVNEWTRFANNIDKVGINTWFERHAKHYPNIKKIQKLEQYNTYRIIFVTPMPIIFGVVGDKQIIENANGIDVTISYEWYWTNNGKQNKIANGISIFFKHIKAF